MPPQTPIAVPYGALIDYFLETKNGIEHTMFVFIESREQIFSDELGNIFFSQSKRNFLLLALLEAYIYC